MALLARLTALVLSLLVPISAAMAAPVLWIDDGVGRIGKIDIATGISTLVGNSGAALTDIAFDPAGNLWGISFTNLYSINKNTGVATNRGSLAAGAGGMNALVFAANGTLYGASTTSTNLFTINTATGAATSLGSTGFTSAGDLAFHGGNLYLSSSGNQLIRVNIANPPASVAVGPLGFASVFGLATADNNVLYGVSGTQVISVNPGTGQGTFVVSYGAPLSGANGTAFVTESGAPPETPVGTPGAPIPTLSQWGIILLGAMLAWVTLRSRKLRG